MTSWFDMSPMPKSEMNSKKLPKAKTSTQGKKEKNVQRASYYLPLGHTTHLSEIKRPNRIKHLETGIKAFSLTPTHLQALTRIQQGNDVALTRGILNYMFGDTEVFRLLFHTTPATVTTSGAGSNQQVYPYNLGAINSASSLLLFDEYRLIAGSFHYQPSAQSTYDSSVATGHIPVTMGAGVDYDDAGAVGSLTAMWAHTNAVISCTNQPIHLPIKLMALPDKDWITTATTTTNVAWGKLFITGASLSVAYGVVYGTLIVDFRLVQA